MTFFHFHLDHSIFLAFFMTGSPPSSLSEEKKSSLSFFFVLFPRLFKEFSASFWNFLFIFCFRNETPILTFREHKAAVRALCWSPHQYGLLLSGGGNVDKSLKFWNVPKGILTQSIETDSQVTKKHLSSPSILLQTKSL